MLDKQVYVYGVDTGDFYSNREKRLHDLNHKVRVERNLLKKEIEGLKEILESEGYSADVLKEAISDKSVIPHIKAVTDEDRDFLYRLYSLSKIYKHKTNLARRTKNDILTLLKNKAETNISTNGKHHTRQLRIKPCENKLPALRSDPKVISLFSSALTRTLGAAQDTLCDSLVVVQVYYFDVIKDIIYNGFEFNGERYIYFASTAGQIRTKKCMFLKESSFNKYRKTIMCGLDTQRINDKGGINPNKYLAYMALQNSASDEWLGFDIDKCIVVEDFETNVPGSYDYINIEDYSITRTEGEIPITHTDGCGMILPNAFGRRQKNMMIRLPWVKGLLGVFDFRSFISDKGCSPVITDIYGAEHDIISEDVQVIFTRSQFKMWKYYDDWNEYKTAFKEYGCHAGIAEAEMGGVKNTVSINYQMLQSLFDMTDEEIEKLCERTVNKIKNFCATPRDALSLFGATEGNDDRTALQEALMIYPNLLNDTYLKKAMRQIRDHLVKRGRAGHISVRGRYVFILPDLYAFCERLFLRETIPKGLIADGEVFCYPMRSAVKVDCLRSPHLYMEHAVRRNRAYDDEDDLRRWFTTDALYTSSFDLISKVLQ